MINVIIMVVIITMIIKRRELDSVIGKYSWLLLYGRRKTGKTFYVREKANYDKYFIVTKSRVVVDIKDGTIYKQGEFRRLLPLLLENKKIVIDEFHRLDETILSMLQALSGKGKLILITSTMHYFKNTLKEPLLGLFGLKKVGLVDPRDAIIFAVENGFKEKEILENACLAQEPWLAPKIIEFKKDIANHLKDELKIYVPNLVGEVFIEEDIEMTSRYIGILGAIANGKTFSSEISSYLYANSLIEKDNPGQVSQYLKNLVNMGLLKAILVVGKKRKAYQYRHVSPITDFAFYLNEKYAFFETDLDENKIADIYRERQPIYMEWFFEELLSKHYGLQPVKIAKPQHEIDIALRDHKQIRLVAEVKWKRKIDRKEVWKIEEKLLRYEKAKKLLIIPSKEILEEEPSKGIIVWDWRDILNKTT